MANFAGVLWPAGDVVNAKIALDKCIEMWRACHETTKREKDFALVLFSQGRVADDCLEHSEASRYMNEFLKLYKECHWRMGQANRIIGRAALVSNN